MSTYIIGDVQGCYYELRKLLSLVQFNPFQDRLGFVGDLVNRGPNSLEVLRFIKSLSSPLIVLGNHDLFLLMLGYDLISEGVYKHTLNDILRAPDKMELLEWLRYYPLVHYEENNHALLVHAGFPPQWSIEENLQHAKEVSAALQGLYFKDFLKNLFGDRTSQWNVDLKGQERLQYIVNAFTRIRFCDEDGVIDLKANGKAITNRENFKPWFDWRRSERERVDIFFGHWSALDGQCDALHCYALDTGCAWGHRLTALKLETKQRITVPCRSFLRK
ncbi:symmetrical bis(5'-nucleosyl)-tetraphosphatase [Coxiella endosymbiont of Dermacentor marginatus]|uniref:symmetrical bis(5'-nucleosyl)-tetraphosphatase n=1 Tax=Coxiella endosymbiont of Dermacentor marginatus TaxID=1656159 RepID=UPI00222346EA|nr:symmetrical bis(5'-nucleosyl)-tetraphosphatase [Coxiella endosymbiont of Dermacentor marginatus]